MTVQTLQYGAQRIPYEVAYVPNMNGKIAIHVLPTGAVRVDAPLNASLVEIKRGVWKRARWLSGHLSCIHQRDVHVLPREYVSGETHLYLGRRYLIKVLVSKKENPGVSFRQGRLEVLTSAPGRETVWPLLTDWYRIRARVTFSKRLEGITEKLPWLRTVPRWKLRTMKRQWGSCSPGGVLSLNPHLVKAPPACIDYVLLHELCHLRYHNHGKNFYRTLGRHMPEWRLVKQRLDDMAERLLSP